jgi:hypothetical protein
MQNRTSRMAMVAVMVLGGIAFTAAAAPAEAHSRKDIKKFHKQQEKYAKKQYKYAKKQQKYYEKQLKYERRAMRKQPLPYYGAGYASPHCYYPPARSFAFAFGYGR